MKEKLYTIPLMDAFKAEDECPFCFVERQLEQHLSLIHIQLNCDAETITADTSFKDDLGADSLDLFELVMALEDEYNIEIPAEELTEPVSYTHLHS